MPIGALFLFYWKNIMAGLNDNYFLADDSMETPVNPVVTIKAFKDGDEGEEAPE